MMFNKNRLDERTRDRRIQELVDANDKMNRALRARIQNDTVLTNAVQRHNDSLALVIRKAANESLQMAASNELKRSHDLQRRFQEMGLTAVREANDAAVVLIATEIGGQFFEASGFSATASGAIVTNRHVVVDSTGQRASKILVKFANQSNWHPARLVRLADGEQTDLALLQITDGAKHLPAVREIANAVDVPVGSSVATLGYPLGTDLPMAQSGTDEVAKTSLTVGTVSKSVPGLLQIDAFATHGSSGSPVFDDHARVIGVVWGGPKEAAGRIVFAVPADQITALLKKH
jgi:S1-C subfamily serine protease